MSTYDVSVRVKEIEGECPVFKTNDMFLLRDDGVTLYPLNTDRLCAKALSSLLPELIARSRDMLEGDSMAAVGSTIRCPALGVNEGGMGAVLFDVRRRKRF